MLTIHDDPDIPEVHLSPGQDPPLAAIHALVTFLYPSDLEVVVAQHHKPHWKEWKREVGRCKFGPQELLALHCGRAS